MKDENMEKDEGKKIRDEFIMEKLQILEKARELVKEIYDLSQKIENKDFNNQIQRTVMSVLCNIIEGYCMVSLFRYETFLFQATASCDDLKDLLMLAYYRNYMEDEEIDRLAGNCEVINVGINKMMKRLQEGNEEIKEQSELEI